MRNKKLKFQLVKCYLIILTTIFIAHFNDLKALNEINFDPYPIRSFECGEDGPDAITSADFNGDGYIDIAVVLNYYSQISILLNQANTQDVLFSEPIFINVDWYPTIIISEDFDGDGKMDIVTDDPAHNQINLLRNRSKGDSLIFELNLVHNQNGWPILKDDFNNDGKTDLAAKTGSNAITVLKNMCYDGNISFAVDHLISIEDLCDESMLSADFDNDGKIDLATCKNESPNKLLIFQNNSSNEKILFSAPVQFDIKIPTPSKLAAGDFDNNGKIDIAFLVFDGASIVRNESTPGNMNFSHRGYRDSFSSEGRSRCILSCDLNGDKKPDLVFANLFAFFGPPREQDHVSVLINKYSSYFFEFEQPILIGVAIDPKVITAADFDNDGKIDLAVGSEWGRSVSIIHNNSTTNKIKLHSASEFLVGNKPSAVGGGDFNGDNKIDLVVTNWKDNTLSVLKSNSAVGKIEFTSVGTYSTGQTPHGIFIADFNNDKKLDIAVINDYWYDSPNITIGMLSLFKNISDGNIITFSDQSINLGTNQSSIAGGDFNQDGKIDIVLGLEYNSENCVFKNISTSDNIKFQRAFELKESGESDAIAVADFDGDNLSDILVANFSVGDISIFLNKSSQGAISFQYQGDFDGPSGIHVIAAEDLDGDNMIDIIGSGAFEFEIFKNISTLGSINFSRQLEFTTFWTSHFSGVTSISINELTGDEKPDILIGNGNGQFTIYENQCTESSFNFSPAFPGAIILGDKNFFISDLDGDGFKDIAAPRSTMNTVSILRTLNIPTFVEKSSNKTMPLEYKLHQNYPNPFNPFTTITFEIPTSCNFTIKIFDVLGREVRTLIDKFFNQGFYSTAWDGLDNYGNSVNSGVYFYRMESKGFKEVKKALLIK